MLGRIGSEGLCVQVIYTMYGPDASTAFSFIWIWKTVLLVNRWMPGTRRNQLFGVLLSVSDDVSRRDFAPVYKIQLFFPFHCL
jgi:hypothetical protein